MPVARARLAFDEHRARRWKVTARTARKLPSAVTSSRIHPRETPRRSRTFTSRGSSRWLRGCKRRHNYALRPATAASLRGTRDRRESILKPISQRVLERHSAHPVIPAKVTTAENLATVARTINARNRTPLKVSKIFLPRSLAREKHSSSQFLPSFRGKEGLPRI